MDLIARFRKTRRELEMSQESVAKEMGVTLSAVSNWEKRKHSPVYKNYRKIEVWLENAQKQLEEQAVS